MGCHVPEKLIFSDLIKRKQLLSIIHISRNLQTIEESHYCVKRNIFPSKKSFPCTRDGGPVQVDHALLVPVPEHALLPQAGGGRWAEPDLLSLLDRESYCEDTLRRFLPGKYSSLAGLNI